MHICTQNAISKSFAMERSHGVPACHEHWIESCIGKEQYLHKSGHKIGILVLQHWAKKGGINHDLSNIQLPIVLELQEYIKNHTRATITSRRTTEAAIPGWCKWLKLKPQQWINQESTLKKDPNDQVHMTHCKSSKICLALEFSALHPNSRHGRAKYRPGSKIYQEIGLWGCTIQNLGSFVGYIQ